MKKVLWLTFLMAFAFLFSFKLNLSSAAVCCDYCGVAYLLNGNICPDSALCAQINEPNCNSNICGYSITCGSTYYCVYQNGQWRWSTSKPQNFCCSDADCPPNEQNIKGKCRSPSGTGGTPYDYTCVWPPCKTNSDCVDNACCVTSSQDSNQANQGKCVSKGIYSNNATWLCDPPEWNVNQNISTNQSKTQNIFDSILSFFSYLFQR